MTQEYEAHKERYHGLTIRIIQDDDCANPFTDYDCEPDIIGFHSRYNFNTRKEDSGKSPQEFLKEAKAGGYIVAPLFMYDHGGLAFSLSDFRDSWDSGQLGFMFWTREKIAQGWGEKYAKRLTKSRRATLESRLVTACAVLNDFHSGNVYGFTVENDDGESLESCWGFIGNYDDKGGCLEQARESAKSAATGEKEKLTASLAAIQNEALALAAEYEAIRVDLVSARRIIKERIHTLAQEETKTKARLASLAGQGEEEKESD